jgi:carbonic anhydrase
MFMEKLVEGLRKFHGNEYPGRSEHFRTLATEGQSPKTLMISCADSRVVPELITQSEPGDLFVCRNAGNIVPSWQEANGGVSSTIEYAVVALGVTDIVICGHSDCGAMKGLMAPEALTTMPSVQRWLGHASAAAETVKACHPDADDEQTLHAMIEENVIAQLVNLRGHPSVAAAMAKGQLRLHGWVYDIESGGIRALDGTDSTFKETTPGSPLPVADHGRQPRAAQEAA